MQKRHESYFGLVTADDTLTVPHRWVGRRFYARWPLT